MIERYPRFRVHDKFNNLILRDGLIICFFMQRPHGETGPAVTKTLDIYLDAVGRDKLGGYLDLRGTTDPEEYRGEEAEMYPLDAQRWASVRDELRDPDGCVLQLEETEEQMGGFHFEYYGRHRSKFELPFWKGMISALSFWLPTEYLEAQGPGRVREMALAMARELPFNSGYVSLAFNYLLRYEGVVRTVHEQCFQYPGIDVPDLAEAASEMGTRVRGAYWLNFYGQPVLDSLGGVGGLRQRLDLPGVTCEEIGQDKALVSLGEWPQTGAVQNGDDMRPYHTLARLLEPHLHEEFHTWFSFSPLQQRRWHRRFLD